MRVSKEKAAENRVALLAAASRLFRIHGVDGVGVADIAREAGLTHGALYAHFPSKEALIAAAFSYGFDHNLQQAEAWAAGTGRRFDMQVEGLLSTAARDGLETGCPMAASASEIGRQDLAASESFTRAFDDMASMLAQLLGKDIPAARRRKLAMATVAAQIGAIAASRAVQKADPEFADEILAVMEDLLKSAHKKAKKLS